MPTPLALGIALVVGGATIAPALTLENTLVGRIAPAAMLNEAYTWVVTVAVAASAVGGAGGGPDLVDAGGRAVGVPLRRRGASRWPRWSRRCPPGRSPGRTRARRPGSRPRSPRARWRRPRGAARQQVGGRQLAGACAVAGEPVVAEQRPPGTGACRARKNAGRSLSTPPRVGGEPVGVGPHPLERRRPRPAPATVVGHLDAQPAGEPAHLAVEVGRQVVVVHEHDVGLVRGGPTRRTGATCTPGSESISSRGSSSLSIQPRSQSRERQPRGGRGCVGAGWPVSCGDPLPVEVVALVVERDGHVERVPGDHDVRGPRVERHAVERGVGLDEPPVLAAPPAGRTPRRVATTSQSSQGDSSPAAPAARASGRPAARRSSASRWCRSWTGC